MGKQLVTSASVETATDDDPAIVLESNGASVAAVSSLNF